MQAFFYASVLAETREKYFQEFLLQAEYCYRRYQGDEAFENNAELIRAAIQNPISIHIAGKIQYFLDEIEEGIDIRKISNIVGQIGRLGKPNVLFGGYLLVDGRVLEKYPENEMRPRKRKGALKKFCKPKIEGLKAAKFTRIEEVMAHLR
jgi:hypothetical protein